jgi:hypothetical protein
MGQRSLELKILTFKIFFAYFILSLTESLASEALVEIDFG